MGLTAAVVASATGGAIVSGPADRAFDGFAIDSRTLQPGDLFFAIVAARDGHDFVADALARGAAGAVVGPGFSPATREPGSAEAEPHCRRSPRSWAGLLERDPMPHFISLLTGVALGAAAASAVFAQATTPRDAVAVSPQL